VTDSASHIDDGLHVKFNVGLMTRAFVALALNAVAATGCWTAAGSQITRVQARPGRPTVAIQPGEHPLGLGGRRDGTLYIHEAWGHRHRCR